MDTYIELLTSQLYRSSTLHSITEISNSTTFLNSSPTNSLNCPTPITLNLPCHGSLTKSCLTHLSPLSHHIRFRSASSIIPASRNSP
jgi:hypothetical protein